MRRLSVLLAASLALGACSERFDGFSVETPGVRADVRIVPEPVARPDELRFRIGPRQREHARGTLYVRPDAALLKIDGYLPIRPDEVTEAGDDFLVTMRVPPDNLAPFAVRRTQATLYLPTETGELAFTGLEHRTPGVIATGLTLVPRQSGPVTGTLKRIGAFLYSLYGAH